MQHDDLIWSIIGHSSPCSFKVKVGVEANGQNFCRNTMNVTGLCSRQSCPLANSQYATVRESNGRIFLYMKTIERAHTPKYLWEKVELPRNYKQALAVIDEHLQYWTKFSQFKCKQRFTKIHQYLIRMRKLRKETKVKRVMVNQKVERRERTREKKALDAAMLEKSIEKELLERLKSGVYGDIYNFPTKEYESALQEVEQEEEQEQEEEDFAYDENYEGKVEFVEGPIDSDDDSDIEDMNPWTVSDDDNEDANGVQNSKRKGDEEERISKKRQLIGSSPRPSDEPSKESKRKPSRKKPRRGGVQIEYEEEIEVEANPAVALP